MAEAKRFDLRCEDCDFNAEKTPWRPGDTCPKCKSEKYYPEVEGAARKSPDALTADDVRFGRLAKWARFVRTAQLDECRAEQKTAIKRGGEVPPLSEIMVQKGYLSEEQIAMLLNLQEAPVPTQDETQFLQTAKLNGFITQPQVAECANLQTKLVITGKGNVSIVDILLEKGYINEDQVGAILRAQRTKNRGLLSALDEEATRKAAVPGSHEIRTEWSRFNRSGWRHNPIIAALAVLVVIVVSAWLLRSATRKEPHDAPAAEVTYQCAECEKRFKDARGATPRTCKHCGKASGYYRLICSECRNPFLLSYEEVLSVETMCKKCKGASIEK